MTKYKKIAIPAQDTLSCEIFQRVGFSHGYNWLNRSQQVHLVGPADWLVFDPNQKELTVELKKNLPADVLMVGNVNELAQAFITPPPLNVVLVNTSKTLKAELIGNGVTFKSTINNRTMTVDNEIVKMVADSLGFTVKPTSPLVKFEYPDSTRNGLAKMRYVRLTSLDDAYLKGYEVGHPNSNEVGEFKNFIRNRILNLGTVELVKFSM